MNTRDQHIEWIDAIRVVAIVLVVLCHSTEEGIYDFSLNSFQQMSTMEQIFPFLCFSLGRAGVPFFLLITGFLLFDKTYNSSEIKSFLHRKWSHLIACTLFWFVVYDLFQIIFLKKPIPIWNIIEDMCLLHSVPLAHAWYLPMIIGMYALIPIFANGLTKLNNSKVLVIPLLFYIAVLFFVPLVSNVFDIVLPDLRKIHTPINSGFSGGVYGIYLILGYLVKKKTFSNIPKVFLIALSVLPLCAVILLQIWMYSNNVEYKLWYDNPFLLCGAVFFFELFRRCSRSKRKTKIIKWLASYSFAIYLIHYPIKLLILDHIKNPNLCKEIQVIILSLILYIVSLALAAVVSKIPKVGNYVLYRKYICDANE